MLNITVKRCSNLNPTNHFLLPCFHLKQGNLEETWDGGYKVVDLYFFLYHNDKPCWSKYLFCAKLNMANAMPQRAE